ncbi:hypothetical protein H0E84_07565 [Luteimonas sp. SJ-92]|uniref:Uncharacterized protein n=1 Tax=Luteimonas salinisoli TaxID=2752307 RepID=A0A853JAL7_9GAMM|nr:hypothetical protein [Luteimonas salinisoli]NZA26241.1 hypothetical protein [Luteimonas salinisoli]
MKYWGFSFVLLALGGGVLAAWHFLDFSFWFAAPGIVLILLGLMPLSAAKEHARQQSLVHRGVDGARPGARSNRDGSADHGG